MKYSKLIALSTAVVTIGGYVFNFNNFNSKDNLIKQGIDRIKEVASQYKKSLEDLQAEYDSLMNDLSNTQDALEQARIKLKQIYQKITGTEWDEANGDILEFDFESLLKDGDQYDNNVDGDAIGAVLGLPAGCSTQDIIDAINDLIATVQSLEARIQVLEGQVADLQAEIDLYEEEQNALVEEINGLKTKLDNATAEANAIIDNASAEEQAQLDYINNTLTELGAEQVTEQVPEEDPDGDDEGVEQNVVFTQGEGWNANANTILKGLNSLNVTTMEDPNVVLNATAIEGNTYTVSLDNEEVYNQLVGSSTYKDNGNSYKILISEGKVLSKAAAEAYSSSKVYTVKFVLNN